MAKKRILIVDDEPEITQAMQIRLVQADYDVLIAHDGDEALKTARAEMPDLIVLDLMLPKMDGHKVCGLLKADTRYKDIPIIMLTAKAQQEDRKISKELGAEAYLTKPYNFQVLQENIEELTKGK